MPQKPPDTLPADFFDGQAAKAPPAPDTLPADFFDQQAAPPAQIASTPAPRAPLGPAPKPEDFKVSIGPRDVPQPEDFSVKFTGPLADPNDPASALPSPQEAQQLAERDAQQFVTRLGTRLGPGYRAGDDPDGWGENGFADASKKYIDELTKRPAQAPIPSGLQQPAAGPTHWPVQVGSPKLQLPAKPRGFINPQITQPTANQQRPAKPGYEQGIEALQAGDFKTAHEILSQPPEFVSKPVDELNKFLVGPFQFQGAILKAAAGLTSPENMAIGAATAGLGAAAQSGSALMQASAKALNAGLSTYFASQAGKSMAEHRPELEKAWKAGDLSGVASNLGFMSADAMLIYFAGKHAEESAQGAESSARDFGDQFREGGRYGKPLPTRGKVVADYAAMSDDELLQEANRANRAQEKTTKEDIAREIIRRRTEGNGQKRIEPGAEPIDVGEQPPDTLPPDFFDGDQKPGPTPSGEPPRSPGGAPVEPEKAAEGEAPAKPPLPKMNDAMQAAHDQATAMVADAEKDGDSFRIDAAKRHLDFIEDLVRASQYKAPPGKRQPTTDELVDTYRSNEMQPSPQTVATDEEIRAGAELALEQHAAESQNAGGEGAPAGGAVDSEANAEAPEAAGAVDGSERSGEVDAGSPAEGEGGQVAQDFVDQAVERFKPRAAAGESIDVDAVMRETGLAEDDAQAVVKQLGDVDPRIAELEKVIESLKGKPKLRLRMAQLQGTLDKLKGLEPIKADSRPPLQPRPVVLQPLKPAAPVKPAPPPKPKPEPLLGKTVKVKTAAGDKLDVQYAVVDESDLVASHDLDQNENPNYPQERQPRARDRKASAQQIALIGRTLDPLDLGESYKAADGAPIVDEHLIVESGNGRTLGIRTAILQHPELYAAYRAHIIEAAAHFGLDPAAIDKIKNPVLVRIRRTAVDPRKFAREANKGQQAKMADLELARADAEQMTPEMVQLFNPKDDGELVHPGNAAFIRMFMGEIVGDDAGDLMTADGGLSQAGARRIRNAIFAKAYGAGSTLEKMSESLNSNVKIITAAMLKAAPAFVKISEAIRAGTMYDRDLTPDLSAAVKKLEHLRETGVKVQDYLDQVGLFGDDLSVEARQLLKLLTTYARSSDKLGRLLDNYQLAVTGLGNPNQASMFDTIEPPSKSEMIEAAAQETEAQLAAIKKAKDDAAAHKRKELLRKSGSGESGDGEGVDSAGAQEAGADEDQPLFSRSQDDSVGPESLPGFFSQLENVIADKMPAQASAQQLAGILKLGVKREELAQTGILDWIAQQGPKITKADVQEYLQGQRLNIHEVVRGEEATYSNDEYTAWRDEHFTWDPMMGLHRRNGALGLHYTTDDVFDAYKKEKGPAAEMLPARYQGYTLPGAKEQYRELIFTLPGNNLPPKPKAKPIEWIKEPKAPEFFEKNTDWWKSKDGQYEIYQLESRNADLFPSGYKYVGWDSADNAHIGMASATFEQAARQAEQHHADTYGWLPPKLTELPLGFVTSSVEIPADPGWGDLGAATTRYYVLDRDANSIGYGETPEEAKRVALAKINADRYSKAQNTRARAGRVYQSGHWSEKNVVLHVRLDHRQGPDGEPMLFVEEIQSDWHQAGRKKGYEQTDAEKKAANDAYHAALDAYATYRDNLYRNHRANTPEEDAEIDRLSQDIQTKQDATYRADSGVPHAPFKKTWHELAVKRLLAYAVSEGLPSISWTTGAQQAARYDLSKTVGGIAYAKIRNADDTYSNEGVFSAWTPDGDEIVRKNLTPEQVADYVGKEAADKLMAQTPVGNRPNGERRLEGLDLQVGGEGMRGFYDKILPTFINSYVKKWGGQVGESSISVRTGALPPGHAYAILGQGRSASGDQVWKWFSSMDNPLSPDFATREQAILNRPPPGDGWFYVDDNREPLEGLNKPVTEKVHSLAITPAIAAGVAAGQPLYAYPKFGGPRMVKGVSVPTLADQSRVELGRFGPTRAPVVYVNEQAFTLIRRAGIVAAGDGASGMSMTTGMIARVITNLTGSFAGRPGVSQMPPGRQAAAKAIVDAIENAQRISPGPVAFVRTDGYSDADIKKTTAEEVNHGIQRRATGELSSYHLGGFAATAKFLATPNGKTAAGTLAKAGYDKASDADLALEIGVRLMEPGRHGELGLTIDQAEDLAEQYVAALNAAHSPLKIDKVIQQVYKAFGEQLNGKDRAGQAAVVFGRRPGQQDSRAVGQNSPRAGAGSVPRSVARANGQGSLFANKRLEGEQSDLFGDDGGAQRDAEEMAKRQLTGDQLSAEFNAELTRSRKVKKGKAPPQTNLFEDTPEEPQGSLFAMGNRGAVNLNLATLGLQKLYEKDIKPGMVAAGKLMVASRDELLRMFAPGARGPNAALTHAELRNTGAELARRMDIARAALKEASKQLMKLPEADRWDFVDRVELGQAQPNPELQGIADTMRDMLDAARMQVQALGKGKLSSYYKNYFPHIWADPQKAAIAIASMISRRPFDGKKGFLKKRTIITVREGMKAGLEPVSKNPVEMVLAKLGEMQRYITAQNALTHEKAARRMRYVDAREGRAPKGWQKVEDAIAVVYGDSIQHISEYPNEGLWNALGKTAAALGIKHERGFDKLKRGNAIGVAQMGGGIKTLHGTAEDVVAHEIGHQIDWLAGSGRRFVIEYPDPATVARLKAAYKTLKDPASSPADKKAARAELKSMRPQIADRKEFARQLRALADLRSGRPEYTHKREEKMAQLAEMWVGARELFERTAPKVFAEWKKFLNDNPRLHTLRDIEGNTEVAHITQPYDVGGLVIKGHWWAPEESARLFNNYLAPGLRSKSALFRGYMGIGNVLLQFQLGWSAFHATFVSLEAMTSRFALGIYQANHGAPLKGLKSMAIGLTPAPPFQNYYAGKKIQRAWERPGSQTPMLEQMADAVASAGGRAFFEHNLQTTFTEQLVDAVRAGNILGGMLRIPFAMTEQAARPVMQYLVPRMKLGAFAKIAEFEIERLGGAAADPEQVRLALGKAWDSVDNRFGQLVYDNLAWHRVLKDSLQGALRTVGWNTGDVKEIGGGTLDLTKAIAGTADQAAINMKLKKGVYQRPRLELSHRASYLLALGVVVGVYGGIMNKILSGDWPEELTDLYYPKDGEGGRVSMASYVKEIVGAHHDPVGWAKGKLNPMLTLFADIITNKDYFGRAIADPDAALVDRALARLKYVGSVFKPISIQGLEKSDTGKQKILPFVGLPRAPKYITGDQGVSDGGGVLDPPAKSRAGSDPELDRLLGR